MKNIPQGTTHIKDSPICPYYRKTEDVWYFYFAGLWHRSLNDDSYLSANLEPIKITEVDWSLQHCGVHQAEYGELVSLMPDLVELLKSFPEDPNDFIWDVKVHMLMPNQYPCIPNWHYDNIPRVNNKQDFDLVKPDAPMYLWLSGAPLTEFRKGGKTWFIKPKEWIKFTQMDEHRGTMSEDFQWRGFIRATHKSISPSNTAGRDKLRRHSQVYLDVENFRW